MDFMLDVYVYVEKGEYNNFIKLFQKYNVCCKDSDSKLVGKYTFKKHYFECSKGDMIFKIHMNRETFNNESYLFGEKLFEFGEKEKTISMKLMSEGDEIALEVIGMGDKKYKAFEYLRYKMFEALPFTDKEYNCIRAIQEFDFDEFKASLDEEGTTTIEDLIEYEELILEPSEPEKKYMDKIKALFDIIDNEVEESVRFPEDETKALINIDLTPIKKELKDSASDCGIKIKIGANGLEVEIIEPYKVIKPVKMEELKDLYTYIYEDSNYFRITLARELRQKETGYLY